MRIFFVSFIVLCLFLIIRFSHCSLQCITRSYTSVLAASVPTPNLSSVSCLAVRYRLLPATFPRCQNCARNVAGITFTNPDDDEVDDEFEIPEIGTGMNDNNNPSNTIEDEANADDDDFGDEDDIVDEEEDAATKSSATRTRGRQSGKRVSASKRVALSLQQKVDIINFYDSSKDSTSKPISPTQLGICRRALNSDRGMKHLEATLSKLSKIQGCNV